MRPFRPGACALALLSALVALPTQAQERVVEVRFTPSARAQIAIWIETADGEFLRTLRLTESTALRGIGNRPGATQMNSGFRWPYGRREGVLPIWAHRRLQAQPPFQRVIFQDRISEGHASRSSNDASPDHYFCLSFNQATTSREALDAVTCASQFNSDKGRYAVPADMTRGYAEPFEMPSAAGMEMRLLDTESLYPPRRDVTTVGTYDHASIATFNADARAAMPEIDAVTMATLPGAQPRNLQLTLPADWLGEYVLYVEVNVEGDYNDTWGPSRYPTPTLGDAIWDFWAKTYGYPYRGQPSVVYAIPIRLDGVGGRFTVGSPQGYGSLHGEDGDVRPMDATLTDDPTNAPGSGADRLLRRPDGVRVEVNVIPTAVCSSPDPPPQCFAECDSSNPCDAGFLCRSNQCVGLCDVEMAPAAVGELEIELDHERSWNWAHATFIAPATERPIQRYELRVSTEPFEDGMSFSSWGTEAKIASLDDVALVIPTDPLPGDRIEVSFGHLSPQTHYFIGLRAVDGCGGAGPVEVRELTTTEIIFTTVSPCFVATAAYGTSMAEEVGALRRFRDRHLRGHYLGEAIIDAYYEVGPVAADLIRDSEVLRAMARVALDPLVTFARWITD
ncbi:MAG: hypothetical protein KF901_14185 [Myxococcales bacterium]|nr:hypothetical protein [Myxococcales bacterium]